MGYLVDLLVLLTFSAAVCADETRESSKDGMGLLLLTAGAGAAAVYSSKKSSNNVNGNYYDANGSGQRQGYYNPPMQKFPSTYKGSAPQHGQFYSDQSDNALQQKYSFPFEKSSIPSSGNSLGPNVQSIESAKPQNNFNKIDLIPSKYKVPANINIGQSQQRQLATDTEKPIPLDLYVCKGDGNCQFRAISKAITGAQKWHPNVRELASEKVRELPKDEIVNIRKYSLPDKFHRFINNADDLANYYKLPQNFGDFNTLDGFQRANPTYDIEVIGKNGKVIASLPNPSRKATSKIYLQLVDEHYNIYGMETSDGFKGVFPKNTKVTFTQTVINRKYKQTNGKMPAVKNVPVRAK